MIYHWYIWGNNILVIGGDIMFQFKRLKAKIVKDNQITAVHDDDLVSLLTSLNVLGSVQNGEKKCLFCKKIITLENIDSIVPHEGSIEFTCDNFECHAKLIGLR